MKILKIFGIVVGIHVFALILIFANPGCSSTSKPPPAPIDTMSRPGMAPSVSVPLPPTVSASTGESSPMTAAIAFNPDAPATAPGGGGRFFPPTRPGTPVATTLVAEPVADVVPATTYTVVNGDNLWNLSKKFHLSAAEIAAANSLKTNAMIHAGQKLIIPGRPASPVAAATANPAGAAGKTSASGKSGETAVVKPPPEGMKHVVKAGETLSTIAHKYGVKQGDIAVANNISDPQKIRAGMELMIPGWQNPSGKSGKSQPRPAADTAPKSTPPKSTEIKSIFNVEGAAAAPKPASDVPVIRIDDSPPAPKGL